MILAAMQPYVFPYLGYFQLIREADAFYWLDGVAFIRRGWSNRNVLVGRNGPVRFVYPVLSGARDQSYAEVRLSLPDYHIRKFLEMVSHHYQKAPFFDEVFPVIQTAVSIETDSFCELAMHSTRTLCRYMGIETPLTPTASWPESRDFRGEARILALCRRGAAHCFLNAEGGRDLYDPCVFASEGIELRFLCHSPAAYPQPGDRFVPRASTIDALMNNSIPKLQWLLDQFDIQPAGRRTV